MIIILRSDTDIESRSSNSKFPRSKIYESRQDSKIGILDYERYIQKNCLDTKFS